MKKEDAEKKMAMIKAEIERTYPTVTADVQMKEWERGNYHRLYIDLLCKGVVDGTEHSYVASFGFINLKSNRYSTDKGRAYDMLHFNADDIREAKDLYEYAMAYKVDDDKKYTPNSGYREIFGLNEKELEEGISRWEMLDKSFKNGLAVADLETAWLVIDPNDVVTSESDFGASDHGAKEIVEFAGDSYRLLRKYGKERVIGTAVKLGDRFNPFGAVKTYMLIWEDGKPVSAEWNGEKVWRVPSSKRASSKETQKGE